MTPYAKRAILLCLVVAVSNAAITGATFSGESGERPGVLQLIFTAGPLLFLALLAWRRRHDAESSLTLYLVALISAIGGLLFLGVESIQSKNRLTLPIEFQIHPLLVPLLQWVAVVGTWIALGIQEVWVKRDTNKMT